MDSLTREERHALRGIQDHLRATRQETGAVIEQVGTVDVVVHPTSPDPDLNCVMPHKGVAWIRREDLRAAFTGLERLGRTPRLIFMQALFPTAFSHQLALMGLVQEETRPILVYRPLLGPALPDERLYGTLSECANPIIDTALTMTESGLAAWLSIVRSAEMGEAVEAVAPEDVAALATITRGSDKLFVLARYDGIARGAAYVACYDRAAGLDVLATFPGWHGMGMESPLIATGVRAALACGSQTIFTLAPTPLIARLCRRMGFVDLTEVLIYYLPDKRRF
jgi:hypothetical protein